MNEDRSNGSCEEELQRFFELSPDLFCVAGFHGLFTRVNPSFVRLMGYTEEELLGKPFVEFVFPEDREPTMAIFGRLQQGKTTLRFENRYCGRAGQVKWLRWSATSVPEEKLIYAVARDVTELKQQERALRKSEERLAEAQRIAHVGNWEWDIARGSLHWSDEIYRIFGLIPTSRGTTYKNFLGAVHPDDRERVQRSVQETLEAGTPYELDHRIVHPDGTVRVVRERGRVFRDESGKPVRMAGTAQDITDWRQAQEERLRLEKELREGHEMRLLGQLTSGVAHEVRNPLNGILALSEALILEVGDNPQYRRYIQLMWEQAKRLSALMEDLLTLGKPAQLESYADIPVGSFVESTVRDWRQTLAAVHHPVSVRISDGVQGCTVKGHAPRLEQVLINLLDNAAGYAAEGNETTVSVHCRDKGWVSIEIADRGPGISREDLSKVFDPFFTTRKGGVGLGLAIVRSIVERHGGDVSVRNNAPQAGVTVTVRLPLTGP